MYTFLVVLLLLFGVGLFVAEIFLIPGFGFAGIFGFVSIAASVVLSYIYISPMAGHITLCAAIVFAAGAIYAFIKGKTLEKMALKTDIQSKVDLISDANIHVGDIAQTTSRLAPMGKVRIGETELEAKSMNNFIDPDTLVEIVRIEGNVVIVKEAKN